MRVQGRSMLPTLHPGDILLVNPRGPLRVDELVVLQDPQDRRRHLVKRLRSLGTSTWAVASDNPLEGRDSRHFGSLRTEYIVGTVAWVWPCR